MFKSILIPTDFTPAAWKAMQVGIELGKRYQSHLTLMHVYPVSTKFLNEKQTDYSVQLDKVKESMERMSKEIVEEKGLKISNVVLSGNIEKQLLTFVKEHHFDLIIMGVNSNGEDNSPGSHTVKAIEQSSAPVLVVPNGYSLDD